MVDFFRHNRTRNAFIILLLTSFSVIILGSDVDAVSATTTPIASPATATPVTPTPATASTPAPVRVRAGTAQQPSGAISVTVPLDLIVLTDQVNVAVLSLDLQYNASLLRAANCTTSEAMAPLLCNIKTPGRIKLAGVAAQGIRSEVNLAQLTFELLQTTNRAEPLTLQLGLVGDVNGAAVHTDRQNGAITLSCSPESEECTSLTIYLPVVHR